MKTEVSVNSAEKSVIPEWELADGNVMFSESSNCPNRERDGIFVERSDCIRHADNGSVVEIVDSRRTKFFKVFSHRRSRSGCSS